MATPKSLQQIINQVKVIVVDAPIDLVNRIETDIQRAQEDAEDYWNAWPFLNDTIELRTLQYQYAQLFSGIIIKDEIRDGFMRFRTEIPPWYTYDGIQKPVEMQWSVGSRTARPAGGMESPGDLSEIYTKDDVEAIAGPPKYIGISYDGIGGGVWNNVPTQFYIDPPCDLGDPDNPGIYNLRIPVQVREPQLSTSGTTENYWTRFMARYLENAAAANFLATNQDPRYLEYRNMADRDIRSHKSEWKRRLFKLDSSSLTPTSGVYGTRNTTRL